MGVAWLRPDSSACVTLAGPRLRTGERLWFFLFDPPRVVDGTIEGGTSRCDSTAAQEGESYRVRLSFAFDGRESAVAMFAPGGRVEFMDGKFVIRTPGAGTPLTFRRCASNEGLHLTVWRGTQRLWHAYVYLGFDLEPDCSEEEMGS
jgi:hypothetical protein